MASVGLRPLHCRGELELKGVSFAYPMAREQIVLRNLTFQVSPGSTVALVGASGEQLLSSGAHQNISTQHISPSEPSELADERYATSLPLPQAARSAAGAGKSTVGRLCERFYDPQEDT